VNDRTVDQTPADIVYILGAGRSGSTLLGIILGSLPETFFAGELFAWSHFSGVPISDRRDVTEFWKLVKHKIPNDPIHLTDDYYLHLERWSALFHTHFWKDSKLREHHAFHNRLLFRSIQMVTGATTIIDSSHFPLRAMALRNDGILLKVIYLVRDPRDVIRSLGRDIQRRAPLGPFGSAAYCWITALTSWYEYSRVPEDQRVFVRYEELVADPIGSICRLCESIDLPCPTFDPHRLVSGLAFNGNRIRHEVIISVEDVPSRSRGNISTWFGDVLVWPLRHLLGYH